MSQMSQKSQMTKNVYVFFEIPISQMSQMSQMSLILCLKTQMSLSFLKFLGLKCP